MVEAVIFFLIPNLKERKTFNGNNKALLRVAGAPQAVAVGTLRVWSSLFKLVIGREVDSVHLCILMHLIFIFLIHCSSPLLIQVTPIVFMLCVCVSAHIYA